MELIKLLQVVGDAVEVVSMKQDKTLIDINTPSCAIEYVKKEDMKNLMY